MSAWPDLTALELLVAVADHGSLGAGARAVGMAQPNASRSMARLERHLGLSLLVRSASGSKLTPSGLLVVDWARHLLDAATQLARGAATLSSSGEEKLIVAASQSVAEHLLPAWLSALRGLRPSACVAVHVCNTSEVMDAVAHGRCGIGFIEGPAEPRGVHHQVVARDELVLVVAPDHPWAGRRRPVEADELANTPLITREAGSGTRTALDEALGRPVRPILELPSNAAVRVSVGAGTGPAVLSRLAVAEAVRAGTLRIVPLSGLELRRPLRAVWTGPRALAGAAADLVSLARNSV